MKKLFAILVIVLLAAATFAVSPVVADDPLPDRTPEPSSFNPWTAVLTLNPTWDPNGKCLEPFSSVTGYNGVPQWEHHTVDLSAYANKVVKLRFYFDTMDPLYNKFEGWYIDNIVLDGFSDDVEHGDFGWDITGSHTTPTWHISSARSAGGSHSWRYADPSRGTFQAGLIVYDCQDERNWGALTSSIMCLGPSPTLEFDTLWEIESVDPHAFDMMYVQIEVLPDSEAVASNGLNLCELQKGDVLMQDASSLVWLAEAPLFDGQWGHTGMYHGGGVVVHSDEHGVHKEFITKTGFWTAKRQVALRLKDEYNHETANKADGFAVSQLGKPYNYSWWDKEPTDKYYCSQLAWRSYYEQTVDLDSNYKCDLPFARSICESAVAPDEIYHSPYLRRHSSNEGNGAVFYLASPAHLYVTDPQGRHTGVDPDTGEVVNEIPEVFYSGTEVEPEFVAINNLEGIWNIEVVGVGTGSYTLATEVVDLDNHQIQMVTGTTEPGAITEYQAEYPSEPGDPIRLTLVVTVDIKPGSNPNSINCNNEKEVVAVAILTTEDFDATTVDHTTVTLEAASEMHVDKKTGEPRRHEEDVDGDGDIDLVFHFRLGDTDLTCDSTEGTLTGETYDGQAIKGTDAVRMIDRGGGKP